MQCSFCGRKQAYVWRLISGPPGTAICDGCVYLVDEILSENPELGTGSDHTCAFCGASGRDVKVILSMGTPATICANCAGTCSKIMKDLPLADPWYPWLRRETTGWITKPDPDAGPPPPELVAAVRARVETLRSQTVARLPGEPTEENLRVWSRLPIAQYIDDLAYERGKGIPWGQARELAVMAEELVVGQ